MNGVQVLLGFWLFLEQWLGVLIVVPFWLTGALVIARGLGRGRLHEALRVAAYCLLCASSGAILMSLIMRTAVALLPMWWDAGVVLLGLFSVWGLALLFGVDFWLESDDAARD